MNKYTAVDRDIPNWQEGPPQPLAQEPEGHKPLIRLHLSITGQ